ncbi:MAG: ribonucleoside-diphosphate reductase [Candidatus Nanohaloarchaeota archaeon QJJ-9]|nr:ribonucleoside-diphosphate reductase [Candidatus Nanohaloarchaeota archaeon QJJ-9]
MNSSQEDSESFKLPVKRVEGEKLEEKLTDNVYERILPARYLKRDEEGNVVEDPEDLFDRVAKNVAKADKDYIDYEKAVEQYKNLMADLKFMPNSPTLMNAGNHLQQLSACFVLHPEDSMDSIFSTVKEAAKIFQSGGGVGYPFHLLRPKGDAVSSTGGVASGPLTFMQVYDEMCGTVKQGGKRRGAQMAVMKVEHPDILRFIVSKREEGDFSNFNISVGVTDEFMEAVRNDETYTFYNPQDGEPHKVTEANQEFYNTDEEYYPQAQGSDIEQDKNFWRDYADSFEGVNDFDIELEKGEVMELPAKLVWNAMVDSAWRNGEPGLFMIDEANRRHSFDVEEQPDHRMESTNPCVTGDTLVSTEKGMVPIVELVGEEEKILLDSRLSDKKFGKASEIFETGTKEVYRLKTREGYSIKVTEDHRFRTEKGWKEAGELSEGEEVFISDRKDFFGEGGTVEEGRVLGWLVGDGQVKNSEERAVLRFYGDDRELSEEFAGYMNQIVREPEGNGDYEIGVMEVENSEPVEERVRSARFYEQLEDYDLVENKVQVPGKLFRSSRELATGFLQGLFTADGSVQGTVEKGVSVRLSSSELGLLEQVQKLLLNYGIYSKIYSNRRDEQMREMPDGKGGSKEYRTKPQHDLVVSKDSLETFREEIGFLLDRKQERLEELLEEYDRGPYTQKFKATVESFEELGEENVYDLKEPGTHSFIANGFVVHNCGEEPLENYEACNLGHINLSLMVEDKGDGSALKFNDWKKKHDYDYDDRGGLEEAMQDYLQDAIRMDELERVAKLATRFLDNVATMSNFPLEEIEEKVSSTRKIGLGLMGFAQLLIQLGIPYGSEESYAAAKEIQRLLVKFSVEKSHELAEERGRFAEWEDSKWASPTDYPEWFRNHTGGKDPEEYKDGFELRNHKTTTIAPTGTTSMIANTSGGCEPIFSLAYFKNVGKDIQGEDMLVEFDDYFLKTLEENDIDVEKVKEEAVGLMESNEWEGVESLPDEVLPEEAKELFVTADSVSAKEHVNIQAAFQEYNHAAISKTCNFPNDATRDDIAEAYMLAYDEDCKGLTVYRDGSRETQVMTTRKDNKLEDMDAEEVLDKIKENYGGVKDFLDEADVSIGFDRGEADEPRDRPSIISGTTQKIDTGYGSLYVTINEDEEGVFELFTQMGKSGGFTHSLTEGISRLSSLALRSGVDPERVVDQLEGIRSPKISWDNSEKVLSIPDGIAKAINRYVEGEAKKVQANVSSFSEEGGSDEEEEELEDNKEESSENNAEQLVEDGKNPECPECGAILTYSEGCVKCENCGYSECG